MKFASNFGRDHLISFGTNFGKFTKTGKFRLHVTALDFLAPYAKVGEFRPALGIHGGKGVFSLTQCVLLYWSFIMS